jgi:hypothetical protein
VNDLSRSPQPAAPLATPSLPAAQTRRPWGRLLIGLALVQAACTGQVIDLTPPRSDDGAPLGPGSAPPGAGGMIGTGIVPPGAPPVAGQPPAALVCSDLGKVGAPVPMRRLTSTQVERTVAEVLGVKDTVTVSDERLFTYRSNISTSIDASGARAYLDFAERVAERVDIKRCATASCLPWLLDEVGLRLFRRPLAAEQRTRYESLYKLGEADGPRWVLAAMVQSPSFLYLDEVAKADGYLDDYGVAARLSLVLWGTSPDLPLLTRASKGGLSTQADIRAEAARMLADPRSEGGLRDFIDQWLELHRLDEADSRPDLQTLGRETLDALRIEPVRLVQALLAQKGGLKELLTTQQTVKLAPLTGLYGADLVGTSAAGSLLDAKRRAGILSLPGVMAALSHASVSSPTMRGYAVLANFLCAPPPPPPAGVQVTLPDVGPNASARERLEAHFSDATCGACHRTMDGIGFAFERIDWLGRSRDRENGHDISAVSTFLLGGQEVTVDGAPQLAQKMAESEAVADCVARQWARYATGVRETSEGECLMQRLGEEIPKSDGLSQMMLTYLSSDWFRRARGDQ